MESWLMADFPSLLCCQFKFSHFFTALCILRPCLSFMHQSASTNSMNVRLKVPPTCFDHRFFRQLEEVLKLYQFYCSLYSNTGCIHFAPDRTIVISHVNAPGSVHDSSMVKWGHVYDKLKALYQCLRVFCVLNVAFNKRKKSDCLIKSSQSTTQQMTAPVNSQATSVCPTAEWGM